MSKLATYIGILSTVLLGLHIFGLVGGTPTSTILSWITSPESFNSTAFFTTLIAVLTLFGVSAIISGLFFQSRTDQAALISLTTLLLLVGWDIIGVYNAIKIFNADFALVMISPLLLVYMLTVIEWWRSPN